MVILGGGRFLMGEVPLYARNQRQHSKRADVFSPFIALDTGVPRPFGNAHPPRIPIRPQASAYCRVLRRGIFS